MDTFLGFPEQYYVGKKYDPAKFFGNRAVSAGNKKLIECISDLEIAYDLKFQDASEIIVFFVRVDKSINIWTDNEIARLFASKISYHSMVVIHDGYVAHIYSFDSQRKKIHDGMNVLRMHGFIEFEIKRPEKEHVKVLKQLRKAIVKYDSAENVCKEWNRIIDKFWRGYKRTVHFGCSSEKWLDIMQDEKDKRYEAKMNNSEEDWLTYGPEWDAVYGGDEYQEKYWWWNKDE